MKLFIKNMIGIRCKMIVTSTLEKLGIDFTSIDIGEVNTGNTISPDNLDIVREKLLSVGFVLLDNKKSVLIEKIKSIVVEMIHYSDELPMIKFSAYISTKLEHNYTYLNNIFSENKGVSISHFIIQHKIEKIKELLTYNELNVTEIADKMQYKSVQHLTKQFKKLTGLTPTHFKKIQTEKRICLEDI